jgi:hypothetical protein
LIDDFNTAQGPVVDVAGGGATVSATQAPTAGELWSNRSISVTAAGAGVTTGDPQAVAVGGFFAINNDSLETSTVTLTWTFNAIAGLTGMNSGFFELDILNNNPANIGPTNVSFSLNNTLAAMANLPPIPPGPSLQTIAFNVSPNNAISNNLSLTFNGGLGYDVVLSSITYVSSVPEPSEWAMLVTGIALVGHMARRRKQS